MKYLQPFVSAFEDYLHRNQFKAEPMSLYEPINYMLGLGGKRVRPALVLLACEMYDSNIDKALPASLAIEMFHNFTLMHDDIMDQSAVRRGMATVHEKFDSNTAILSGDALLIQSYAILQNYPKEVSIPVLQAFTMMASELCEGQRMDMDFEKSADVNIGDYLKMIEMKTAVLLATSLKIGAIIGGASESDTGHLYQFGKNIGIAFQIQDDILDTFGDHEVGKKIGGDIVQNKKTYLYLKALELADEAIKKELQLLYNAKNEMDSVDKIQRVTSLYDSLVVKEYATQVMEAYRDLAISHALHLDIESGKRQALIQFAEFMVERNK